MADNDDDSVKKSNNQPDYSAVEIPDKPREEYHYTERRAEILRLVEETGSPQAISQKQLAEEFGVSQPQICKDFKRLAEHIRERLPDRDRRAMWVDSTVKKSINGLLDKNEYRAAAKTAMEYDEWIYDFADVAEIERRLDELENDR